MTKKLKALISKDFLFNLAVALAFLDFVLWGTIASLWLPIEGWR